MNPIDFSDTEIIAHLLNRPQVILPNDDLRAHYQGRRLLITGAGGSIGSEIAKQALALGAEHVSLIDHSELALYEIDRSLRELYEAPSITTLLCSIRDRDRLRSVFMREKPDCIFHAAALKHVPMVELNPSESVLTNVLGTQNVIDSAKSAGVGTLVLISSDKAVAPSSLMGATKRLAEYLIASQISPSLQACTVRFGNVLGSTGSVVPQFWRQIHRGGPLTLTDPEAERFFMSIFEAVQLVLRAAMFNGKSPMNHSGLYVLEMGQPIKIVDLANSLINLAGLSKKDSIELVYLGLREGEKITEILLDDNEFRRQVAEGIFEVMPEIALLPLGPGTFPSLYDLAFRGDDEEAKGRVFELVRTLRPSR